ncbi:FG-GAP-like repeat-containing protein [Candidatus Margulisiibacteriota bacterium]
MLLYNKVEHKNKPMPMKKQIALIFIFLIICFSNIVFGLEDPLASNKDVTPSFKEISSIQDGLWNDPNTWDTNEVPILTDKVIIQHKIQIAESIENNAGEIIIAQKGSLEFSVFEEKRLLNIAKNLLVSGNLIINNADLNFLGVEDNLLDIRASANFVLRGAQDNPIVISAKNKHLKIKVNGLIQASHFVFDKTQGLELEEQARVVLLQNGEFKNTLEPVPNIFTKVSFKVDNLVFDKTEMPNIKRENDNIEVIVQNSKYENQADIFNILGECTSKQAVFVDFNKDNYPDLFLASYGNSKLFISQNGEKFVDKTDTSELDVSKNIRQVKLCDFDLDGDKDILFITKEHRIEFWENIWTGHAEDPIKFQEISYKINASFQNTDCYTAEFIDINQDNLVDIFILTEAGLKFFKQNTSHEYSDITTEILLEQKKYQYFNDELPGSYTRDLDNNRLDDIVLVTPKTTEVYYQHENGFFILDSYEQHQNISEHDILGYQGRATADINQDGAPDTYFVSNKTGNELYLGKPDAKWLAVKVKGREDEFNSLKGTKIIVNVQNKTYCEVIQDLEEVYFKLENSSKVDKLTVIFPSGSIYVEKNISIINQKAITVYEDEAKEYITISGKIPAQSLIEIFDTATDDKIIEEQIAGERYSFEIDTKIKSIYINLKKINPNTNQECILQTPEILLLKDISIGLDFPIHSKLIEGEIAYNSYPISGMEVRAYKLNDVAVTQNIHKVFTDKLGKYQIAVSDGEWQVQVWDNGQFLGAANASYNIDLSEAILDEETPGLEIENIANGNTIKGDFKILGKVTDNFILKSLALEYSEASENNWELIASSNCEDIADNILAVLKTNNIPDGVYDFKVILSDVADNKTEKIVTNVHIQNISPETYKFHLNKGLHLFSVPFCVDLEDQAMGASSWINVTKEEGLSFDFTGSKLNYKDVEKELVEGWNKIANPFHYDFLLNNIKVRYEEKTYSFSEACKQNLISQTLWEWEGQEFRFLDRYLKPWKGAIIYANKNITLVFSKENNYLTIQADENSIDNEVRINLILKNEDEILDQANIIGTVPGASDGYDSFDLLYPPSAPTENNESKIKLASNYSIDIRNNSNSEQVWDFSVNAVGPLEKGLYLELKSLSKLPKAKTWSLYDVQNMKNIKINVNDPYKFEINNPGVYDYQIILKDTLTIQANSSFQLTGLIAYPNPFNPNSGSGLTNQINIKYNVNKAATGFLKIFTVAGRLVRTFEITDTQYGVVGTNTISWNGRDEYSQMLPNDVYFYYLSVTDASGDNIKKKGKIVLWK